MGNFKSKGNNIDSPQAEGYCQYTSNGLEHQIFIKLTEKQLFLSNGQGNTVILTQAFETIKIDSKKTNTGH